MRRKEKPNMTKETIPEGFTVPMALVDFLPVLFFGGTGVILGMLAGNFYVEVCAAVVFLSGFLKVIWKLIAAVSQKNIWPLFLQMRIAMPIGFLGMLGGLICAFVKSDKAAVLAALLGFPQLLFFLAGILGLVLMILCAVKLNSADPRANWIEQGINSFAQCFIFLGTLFILL